MEILRGICFVAEAPRSGWWAGVWRC